MGFGEFLATPEQKITIVTYRDIFQSAVMEEGRFSEEYLKLSAVIKMDAADIKKLDVKVGGTVVVKNDSGKVIVRVEISGYDSHSGIAYMPNSPWSNALVDADTGGSGVPRYKNIEATVSSAKGESITAIDDF
ncbi:MAG: molybdopterin dinucleotide binding domain-containing protein [Methanosarcinaceae archaeon]|nr:formylmethanofuran dehydrogenase [Methanosarcinaceae archaeon]MDF1533285.1 molybdopterin dinucleotide binding domain-containing protein [Methanosarcinaceae archaeon]